MKVKLAAQILSVTVANALYKCGVDGAKYLAEFINDITHLFDSFNGLKLDDTHFYTRPLSNRSQHLEFWQSMKRKLDSWQFVDADVKSARTKEKEAWCQNINVVSSLWRMLGDLGVTSLATCCLNQDPLENLFDVVRQCGIRSNNPTSLQFHSALKSYILNGMIDANGKFNCEKNDADILSNLCEFLKRGEEVKTCAWVTTMPSDTIDDPLIADEATRKTSKILNKIPNLKSYHSCFVSFIYCHHTSPCEGSNVVYVCSKSKDIAIKTFWKISLKIAVAEQVCGK